jgi:hypothetical protein
MEFKGEKFLVLYLTDWQIRMVKDFLGVECHYWRVPIKNNPVVRYKVEVSANPKVKKLYLTDWQKREIRAESGECCDFIELDEGLITEYGVPIDEWDKRKDILKLQLTPEQQEMVKKSLNTECHFLEIPLDVVDHLLYGVEPDQKVKGDIMKFTDEQKKAIKKAFGVSCDFIVLTKAMPVTPYGVEFQRG